MDEAASVAQCLSQFEADVGSAMTLNAVLVSSQLGHDWWSDTHAIQFLQGAVEIANRLGAEVCHHTHRQGTLSDPFRAQRVLPHVPGARIHLDLSAWCSACGRVFDEKNGDGFLAEVLELVGGRCGLIASQLSNGINPQLCHSTDASYGQVLTSYKRWWTSVWGAMVRGGQGTVYTLTDSVVVPTSQLLAFTKKGSEADSHRWVVNKQMHDTLRNLFSRKVPHSAVWYQQPAKKRKLERRPTPPPVTVVAPVVVEPLPPMTDIEQIAEPLPEPGVWRVEMARRRRVYAALDNETPKQIAKKFGIDLKQVLRDNKRLHPGLVLHSKLYVRTKMVLPLLPGDEEAAAAAAAVTVMAAAAAAVEAVAEGLLDPTAEGTIVVATEQPAGEGAGVWGGMDAGVAESLVPAACIVQHT
jgi:hypothetical protein